MIAGVLSLPNELVLDANDENDVSTLDHFVTVNTLSQNEIGQEITFDGVNELEKANSVREVIVSINAYGKNSHQIISKLVGSMRLSPVYQQLKRMKLGYLKASQIRNLPTAIAGGKEQRAQVDLSFSINHIIQANVNRGDSVKIKSEAN